MKRSTKIILLSSLIIVLGVISCVIYNILMNQADANKTTALTGVLSFFTALVPFAFTEVRKAFFGKDDEGNSKKLAVDDEDIFDIFIYGHSGSGKTTLIQRLFTHSVEPIESTTQFNYYETFVRPSLSSLKNKKGQIGVRIADYTGQDANEFIDNAELNLKINALIIVADIAPSYQNGKKLSDDEVYQMMKNNLDGTIKERLMEAHKEYLSKFLLQVVFKKILSTHLRSVRFVINKIDLLEKLQQEGFIDHTIQIETLVKSYFKDIEENIRQFCTSNDITDFEVVLISATKYQKIADMFSTLLNQFIKSNNIFKI